MQHVCGESVFHAREMGFHPPFIRAQKSVLIENQEAGAVSINGSSGMEEGEGPGELVFNILMVWWSNGEIDIYLDDIRKIVPRVQK